MRLNIDTPQINDNEVPPELNRWFTNIVDVLNYMFGNIIADKTSVDTSGGAGPVTVDVQGMTTDSIVLAMIDNSDNAVSVQKVTAGSNGFDILFSADPGATCVINYVVFLSPFAAQGV